jgi:integration host factor subunit beta
MEPVNTLTKADLARHLMDKLELPRKDADLLVNAFLKSIVSALRSGDGVELRGFGSFRLRDRRARMGRNPRSGQSIHVPSKRVVYFKLGKELRARMVDRHAREAPVGTISQPSEHSGHSGH